jgi:hypothetical protein
MLVLDVASTEHQSLLLMCLYFVFFPAGGSILMVSHKTESTSGACLLATEVLGGTLQLPHIAWKKPTNLEGMNHIRYDCIDYLALLPMQKFRHCGRNAGLCSLGIQKSALYNFNLAHLLYNHV